MARVTIWLFVESAATSAEELSRIIGLPCDVSRRKDEPLAGRPGLTSKKNLWRIETRREIPEDPQEVCRQISEALWEVLNRIRGHEEGFAAAAELGVSGVMVGVLAESAPSIELDAALLKAVAVLNVDLEVDLVVG
jgi:hypothetical protein